MAQKCRFPQDVLFPVLASGGGGGCVETPVLSGSGASGDICQDRLGTTPSSNACCRRCWLLRTRTRSSGGEPQRGDLALSILLTDTYPGAKNGTSFLSAFPMFVPSLSWQNDHFDI